MLRFILFDVSMFSPGDSPKESRKDLGWVLEAVAGPVVVVAIGATGYLAYNRMQSAGKTPTASEQAQKATTPSAPEVTGSKDLDKASKALDETNLDASTTDTTELDTEVNSF